MDLYSSPQPLVIHVLTLIRNTPHRFFAALATSRIALLTLVAMCAALTKVEVSTAGISSCQHVVL